MTNVVLNQFNVEDLKRFLLDETASVYRFEPATKSWYKKQELIKINYKEQGFVLVYDTTSLKTFALEEMYLSGNRDLSFMFIYFPSLDCLVFETRYKMEDLFGEENTTMENGMRFICKCDLYNEILMKINLELQKRYTTYFEKYRNEKELVEEKKNIITINKNLVMGKDLSNVRVNENSLENELNWELYHQYLMNPEQFVDSYVNAYEIECEVRIKNQIAYSVAGEEIHSYLMSEQKEDMSVIMRIVEVLDELGDAKTIRVLKDDGSEVSVEARFRIDIRMYNNEYYNNSTIGSYRGEVKFNEVISIRYGRKEFKVKAEKE